MNNLDLETKIGCWYGSRLGFGPGFGVWFVKAFLVLVCKISYE